jgi:hypothetical protein
MRLLATSTVPLAAFAAVLGVAPATTVPDDPDAVALAEFVDVATGQGWELLEPVCVVTETALTYTCYARTGTDELLVATVDLSGAEPDVTILSSPAPPETSSPNDAVADEPNLGPAIAAEVTFDPLRFFDGLFSGDLTRLEEQAPWVQPGSPAATYLEYQRRNVATAMSNGVEIERSYVYLTPDTVRVCVTPEECIEIENLLVENEQLVSFDADGQRIAERFGRPTEPIAVGSTTVQLELAYRTVSNGQLVVFLELSGTGGERLELTTSTYVDAAGNQTPVDPAVGGPSDGAVTSTTTVQLAFPDAVLGGEVRIIARPLDGSTPLAAVIPVVPLEPPS